MIKYIFLILIFSFINTYSQVVANYGSAIRVLPNTFVFFKGTMLKDSNNAAGNKPVLLLRGNSKVNIDHEFKNLKGKLILKDSSFLIITKDLYNEDTVENRDNSYIYVLKKIFNHNYFLNEKIIEIGP